MAGRIRILCVGKVKEPYYREGIKHYAGVLRRFCPFEILEYRDEPIPEHPSSAQEREIRDKEGKRLLSGIREDDYVLALCIEGRQQSTQELRSLLTGAVPQGRHSFTFVIGGSLGLSEGVVKRADRKISFSSMTFPHQLMRLILCEQLAYCISGESGLKP